MSNGIVHVNRLKPRYRAMYLSAVLIGLAGGIFAGIVSTFFLIDLLGLATSTRMDKAIVVLLHIGMWVIWFVIFSSLVIGMLVLVRLISSHDGWLLITGRGVPSNWYR